MSIHQVRILHATIDVPVDDAYAFAHRPQNFPKWAAGLSGTLHASSDGWVAETPLGKATICFTEPNPYGILDHRVRVAGQPEVHIPMRLVRNGDGTEVELLLYRQPGMSDSDFERDAAQVEKDLAALKKLLESPMASS